LPESAAQAKAVASRSAAEEVFPLSSERTSTGYAAAASTHSHLHQTPRNDQPRLPPMGNFAPTPSANRDNKRKRGDRQGGAAVTPTMQAESTGIGSRAGIPHSHVPNKVSTLFFFKMLQHRNVHVPLILRHHPIHCQAFTIVSFTRSIEVFIWQLWTECDFFHYLYRRTILLLQAFIQPDFVRNGARRFFHWLIITISASHHC
jgi:hypothetical protein